MFVGIEIAGYWISCLVVVGKLLVTGAALVYYLVWLGLMLVDICEWCV